VEIISVIGARRVYEVSTEGTIDVTVYPAEFTLLNQHHNGILLFKTYQEAKQIIYTPQSVTSRSGPDES
jgi:hypothetical protein